MIIVLTIVGMEVKVKRKELGNPKSTWRRLFNIVIEIFKSQSYKIN